MTNQPPAYTVGDHDARPWGEYEVTAVGLTTSGEEYCEKKITVLPRQILSLQSHELRRELWRVTSGELTVILNDQNITLKAGESINVPLGSIHAMANVSDEPCVVFERQEGVCREADIKRYLDAYGRGVEESNDPFVVASLATYTKVLNALKSKD
jgi:mannose-1-phosphate guanylyltransferase/mannose-6-phosphate isomerase